MTATISRYVLEDVDGNQDGEFDSYQEAEDAAWVSARNGVPVAVIELEYEYADSSLVWAPGGADTWPPATGEG